MAHPKFRLSDFIQRIMDIEADEVRMHPVLYEEYINWMYEVYPGNQWKNKIMDATVMCDREVAANTVIFKNTKKNTILALSLP
ncbi:MAG: hypothetical protein ACREJN_08300 [Nitrospiraceae bacterium]